MRHKKQHFELQRRRNERERKSSRLYLISSENIFFLAPARAELIYSDFEIVVWWHPNWSPKYFSFNIAQTYERIHMKVHTKEHFSRPIGEARKNAVHKPSISFSMGTQPEFTEFLWI